MKKGKYLGELIVLLVFVGLIGILIVSGPKITGYAVFNDDARKITIDVGNVYDPGENVELKLTLLDGENNKIEGRINYVVQDFYTDVIHEGSSNSNDKVSFDLPEGSVKGLWKITASSGEVREEALFNVRELEKADIDLEGNMLIIRNVGNVPYGKSISIKIGDHSETIMVPLGIGQMKEIKLTAPDNIYDIQISDGTEENTFEAQEVGLTGNVIGLSEIYGDGFFSKYPLVGLFLIALSLLAVTVVVLKINKK